MFGETTISYVKIGNHPIETTIYKWLFGVPGSSLTSKLCFLKHNNFQVIQATSPNFIQTIVGLVTISPRLLNGHVSFHHPKKGTSRIARPVFFFGCLFFFSLVLPRIVVSFWFGGGSEPLKSHNRKPTGRNFLRSRVFLPRRGGTCLPGSSSVDLPSSGLQVDPI